MHLAESKVQAVSGIKRYGTTLTRHVDALGLLGPNFTGAHSVWLDDEDLKVLRDKGASVAHNPSSNLRLGSGIAPLRRMLDLGIAVGIGTDGSATSDNQNIFAAMRAAAYVSRIVEPDPDRWVGSWEVLRAATIGGAQVLGMDKTIGRVAPGYRADLVFLDMRSVNFVPLNNPAYQIVHCEDSSAVDSVMIGGRMVLDGRRLTTFDFDGLRRKAQSTAERIRQENILKRRQYDAMEKFVSRHCIGLACEHYHVRRRADAKA
jgi:guanine deaminase